MEHDGEIEVGWTKDCRVYVTNIEYTTMLLTPEKTEEFAALLLAGAKKARRQLQ
jgi:hypothetical protein